MYNIFTNKFNIVIGVFYFGIFFILIQFSCLNLSKHLLSFVFSTFHRYNRKKKHSTINNLLYLRNITFINRIKNNIVIEKKGLHFYLFIIVVINEGQFIQEKRKQQVCNKMLNNY